jgi:hypothetical protein
MTSQRSLTILGFAMVLTACSPGSSDDIGTSSTSGSGGGAGQGGGGGAATIASSTGGSGTGGGFGVGGFTPTPVMDLPGLVSITFYERTGGTEPTPYEFAVDGAELTTRLADPLADDNRDIPGATSEFYDVYYSDQAGDFQLDGSYLTISGMFGQALPAGGGLNLAEIGLNFSDTNTEYGNYVASYVVLGDNSVEANVGLCIDGDLQTHTTMGNTVGSTERLRLTLGFESTSGPPPQ